METLIRPAQTRDREAVSELLANARWKHKHLDWTDPLDRLSLPPCWVSIRAEKALACLCLSADQSSEVWLSLFAILDGYDPEDLWSTLWSPARDQAMEMRIRSVSALLTSDWLAPILRHSGFQIQTEVIFLEWLGRPLPEVDLALGQMRPMQSQDVPAVHHIDNQAFRGAWRHSEREISAGLEQASMATVVEIEAQIAAYQLTTISAYGAHLARLAVDPSWHGRGIGRALVSDVLKQITHQGFGRLTVNTQGDNLQSRRLYEHLGFLQSGQRYPVYQITL
jgi:ribosomal-protein-alanine N-acetyltransferase